ncbi:MAG: cation:proton antiporter, partial [Acidobacteriota bacterium]
ERFGQPSVLGELVAGMVLGNFILTGLPWFQFLGHNEILHAMAEVGVILLLFEVGFESRLSELISVGKSAFLVATIGVVAPMSLGYGVSSLLFPQGGWWMYLFAGATLSATSVGITARVLKDLKRTESRESKIVLGAAVLDDVLGLIVLAVVSGMVSSLASSGSAQVELLPVAAIIGKAVAFLAGAIWIGRFVHLEGLKIGIKFRVPGVPLAMAVSFCFLLSALAGYVGLAPIVGAFAAGLVLEEADYEAFHVKDPPLDQYIRPMSMVFVPVFFVMMGLRIDLRTFASMQVIEFAALLTAVAILGKVISMFGVIEKGLNRLVVGVGMVPRGEVGLIFVGIAAAQQVAGKPVFDANVVSAMVVMVMFTTMMTPPLLKWAFARKTTAT